MWSPNDEDETYEEGESIEMGGKGRWRDDELMRIGTKKSRYIYLIADSWGRPLTIANEGDRRGTY